MEVTAVKKPRKRRSPATEETKAKMSAAHKGKPKSEAHKKAISDAMKARRAWEAYEAE